MKLHLLLLCLVVCVASASSILALCHDAERSALQHFKQGFSIHPSASIDPFAYPKTRYWKSSHNVTNDCCEWDGVECDEHIGHVIGLDLSSSLLYGFILPNSPLFELVHLQALNLSDNNLSMERPSPQQAMIVVSCYLLDGKITDTYYLDFFVDFNKKHELLIGSNIIPISIDLSHNKLIGKIPDSIRNLHTLQILDLSYNNLTGAIPTSFEELSNLFWLDLSHNSLLGEIPQQLTQLSLLTHFNVSYNQLTGPIPQGGQLTTFENDSFIGNPGLCGSPLSKKCGNHEVLAPPHDSSVEEDEGSADVIGWVIRCMGYIGGLVAGLVLGRMITDENHDWFVETFGRRKQHKKKKNRKHQMKQSPTVQLVPLSK